MYRYYIAYWIRPWLYFFSANITTCHCECTSARLSIRGSWQYHRKHQTLVCRFRFCFLLPTYFSSRMNQRLSVLAPSFVTAKEKAKADVVSFNAAQLNVQHLVLFFYSSHRTARTIIPTRATLWSYTCYALCTGWTIITCQCTISVIISLSFSSVYHTVPFSSVQIKWDTGMGGV